MCPRFFRGSKRIREILRFHRRTPRPVPKGKLNSLLSCPNVQEKKIKDNELALSRWESVVSKGGKSTLNWLEAVNFALRTNDIAKARNFLKRAQGVNTDNPEAIWKTWLDFERVVRLALPAVAVGLLMIKTFLINQPTNQPSFYSIKQH